MQFKSQYPYYLGGKAVQANSDLEVRNVYTGEVATRVALADAAIVTEAIGLAEGSRDAMRRLPPYRRAEILNHCVQRFDERFEELALGLCIEAGKPIRDARGEVTRLIDTFRIAAEETTRFGGEYMSLEISPRADGYESITKFVPKGVLSFITPFNFPLNLTAHKVAPAIAVGAPFVLKPADKTPIGALLIGEILAETDLPEGAFSILPTLPEEAGPFSEDPRLKLLSFTGSPQVGWMLKKKAAHMPVTLELGGNAGCIVDDSADLEFAADRLTTGAFYQSGQSCISVQRVLIHDSVYDKLLPLLVERAEALVAGDPMEESTTLGPIINPEAAERVEAWVGEAVENGAKLLTGGKRDSLFFDATWLENVNHKDKAWCGEVFGPVSSVERFSDFREAIRLVNESDYGLQAGVFTRNMDHAFYAWNELEVGGVVINDIPSMRVDSMPYGGVKGSGIGREGIRYAMQEMSEVRLLVLNRLGRL